MTEPTKIEVQNTVFHTLTEIKGISANLFALGTLASTSANRENDMISLETMSDSLYGMAETLNRIITILEEIC